MRGMKAIEEDQEIQDETARRTVPTGKVRCVRKRIGKLFLKHGTAAFWTPHLFLLRKFRVFDTPF